MLLGLASLLAQAAFSFSSARAAAAAPPGDPGPARQVVILVIDALSVEDFTGPDWATLRTVLARGGMIGLMNARTGGTATAAAAHATIGAGVRARAGSMSGLAFDAGAEYRDQPAVDLYRSLTGFEPDGRVLFLGLAELLARNAGLPGPIVPGALGQAVRDAGGETAVLGNGDLHDAFRRHAVLIAMDARGSVPLGSVGRETLAIDPEWPFGWRTDYDRLWDAFLAVAPRASLIVVELADLARLDAYGDAVAPGRLETLRRAAVRRMDDFVGRVAAWGEGRDAHLLVISPTPPAAALRKNFLLAPVAWAPLGATGGEPANGVRLATSPATRRAGIIANTDVAPTVLAALGIPAPAHMTGRPMAPVHLSAMRRDLPATAAVPEDPWQALALVYRRATAVHELRPPVVRFFIGLAIAVFVVWAAWAALAAWTGRPGPEARRGPWRWMLLLLVAAPLSLLLVPLLPIQTAPGVMAAAAALAGGLASLAHLLSRRDGAAPFAALSVATAAALVVDVLLGAPLIKSSILGYDPIIGARYYGIGNEYMGVLIGTAILGTTGLLDRFPGCTALRWAVPAAYLLVVAVLASPSLGVNVGGTIAAVSGFAVTGLLLWRGRLPWRGVLAAGAAGALVLAAAAWVDVAARGSGASHLGQAAMLLVDGDWHALGAIAARKLQMNLRLLNWTIWSQVLVVSLAISAVALQRPGPLIRRLESRHPHLLRGVRGAVVASLTALAANDSGVVAAATAIIPATATLLYLVTLDRGFQG